ncbi:MAG TPA: four helix bundle protein [Chitinophagales bacterium]|nr:four helix bundle protein [Chitinophagales bacterium]
MEEKISSFLDLNVWKKAHQMNLEIYKLTVNFPQNAPPALADLLVRSSTAVTVCIAEGFQKRQRQEKVENYGNAQSKLTEVQYLLLLTNDLGYADTKEVQDNLTEIQKMLGGLMRSVSGQFKTYKAKEEDEN